MNERDIEMKILRGLPIDIGVCKIYPLTLNDIAEMGEDNYKHNLLMATFNKRNLDIEVNEDITPFELIILYCFQQEQFRQIFCNSLQTFTKETVRFHENGFFYFGELIEQRFVDEQKYEDIKKIIKKQNFLKEDEEKEFKPHNEKARQLIEKMKEVKSKIKQQNTDEGLSLSDIVSIVSSYTPNINILDVWNLVIYQLYMLYMRLIMRDNYESNFSLLPHVSDSKSLDLTHWATKIKQ